MGALGAVAAGEGRGASPPPVLTHRPPPGYLDQSEGRGAFFEQPRVAALSGGRLRLMQGPIDLVLRAEGPGAAAAHQRAVARFAGLLAEVAAELPLLRAPAGTGPALTGIPGRMQAACAGFDVFVTPMAAVAGAVAEAVLEAMRGPGVRRAFVNNGGDIALWAAPGAEPFRIGLVSALATGASPGWLAVPGGGVATSGWPGRSHSLGIADAVTVLAGTAAVADVAATLIANAVDLPGHAGIRRARACDLAPDSDLGCRLVTQAVPPLTPPEIATALDAGEAFARRLVAQARITGAALAVQGTLRLVGRVPFHPHERGSHA